LTFRRGKGKPLLERCSRRVAQSGNEWPLPSAGEGTRLFLLPSL
jgi:hypothetical protein